MPVRNLIEVCCGVPFNCPVFNLTLDFFSLITYCSALYEKNIIFFTFNVTVIFYDGLALYLT